MELGIFPDRAALIVSLVMAAINANLGAPERSQPTHGWRSDSVLELATQLMSGSYRPEAWFIRGTEVSMEMPVAPILLDQTQMYYLPSLKGADPNTARLSTRDGGVLYETPFWFLVAAYSSGRSGRLLLIPRGYDDDDIRSREARVLIALRDGHFDPEQWLSEAQPIEYKDSNSSSIIPVSGSALSKMWFAGKGIVVGPEGPATYVLFRYEPLPPSRK